MKSFEELYNEIMADEKLKNEFIDCMNGGEPKIKEFLQSHGCSPDINALVEFIRSKTGELSDRDLESAAGGSSKFNAKLSVFTLGTGCAALAIISNKSGDTDVCFDTFEKDLKNLI